MLGGTKKRDRSGIWLLVPCVPKPGAGPHHLEPRYLAEPRQVQVGVCVWGGSFPASLRPFPLERGAASWGLRKGPQGVTARLLPGRGGDCRLQEALVPRSVRGLPRHRQPRVVSSDPVCGRLASPELPVPAPREVVRPGPLPAAGPARGAAVFPKRRGRPVVGGPHPGPRPRACS